MLTYNSTRVARRIYGGNYPVASRLPGGETNIRWHDAEPGTERIIGSTTFLTDLQIHTMN